MKLWRWRNRQDPEAEHMEGSPCCLLGTIEGLRDFRAGMPPHLVAEFDQMRAERDALIERWGEEPDDGHLKLGAFISLHNLMVRISETMEPEETMHAGEFWTLLKSEMLTVMWNELEPEDERR